MNPNKAPGFSIREATTMTDICAGYKALIVPPVRISERPVGPGGGGVPEGEARVDRAEWEGRY